MKPISTKTKLKRFFEDEEITRAEIAKATGYAVDYLRNMFSKGSNPLTEIAKYKIMAAYPETRAILMPAAADAEQEATE